MKIEIGESVIYSWLRHVKECQLVQTNWKASPVWEIQDVERLKQFMNGTRAYFESKYGYDLYKENSFEQLLSQAEIDAVGVFFDGVGASFYTVDVAFHKNGLQYGIGRADTVAIVLKKLLRAAMCLVGYFGVSKGEMLFVAPKIMPAVLEDLAPVIADLNALFSSFGYEFTARVIANDKFDEHILEPILVASDGVSDTSELFLRSVQLLNLFKSPHALGAEHINGQANAVFTVEELAELKVGQIARTVLRAALESGKADEAEIVQMQTREYSKKVFHQTLPLLVTAESDIAPARYYSKPLTILGKQYYLNSQWVESPVNNDRPYLLNWLKDNGVVVAA